MVLIGRETDSEQPGDRSGAARIKIVQVHQRVKQMAEMCQEFRAAAVDREPGDVNAESARSLE